MQAQIRSNSFGGCCVYSFMVAAVSGEAKEDLYQRENVF